MLAWWGAVALIVSVLLPLAVRPWLVRLGVVDVPTDRSSHTIATIRGMGLAVAGALVLTMSAAALTHQPAAAAVTLWICAGAAATAALLGWVEDFRGVGVRLRALYQLGIGLVASSLLAWHLNHAVLWLIPAGMIAVAAYINVANFMDGINGISGSHGLLVGLFYAAAGALSSQSWLVIAGLVIAGAFAGFLPWNLGKRNVFLGDVGSYLLGASVSVTAVAAFFCGVSVEFVFAPVLIYLADTFVTLIRRIAEGERWYTPHRRHAYQRLVIVGLSHVQATLVVCAATVLTGLLGIMAATNRPPISVLAGVLCAVVVLLYLRTPTIFQRLRRRRAAAAAREPS